jgi:YD repeat-containing protein
MYYDAMRQLRATVTPDPDGGGSLQHKVARFIYDGDGNSTYLDVGHVASPSSWDSLSILQRTVIGYDGFGRKIREDLINLSTGQSESATQYKYDAAGRVECVAQRMNPAVYSSLPDACSQSSAGSFGPDRIVRTTYDANGDPLVIQSGYGTSLVRNERTFTYLAPGQAGTVKDATTTSQPTSTTGSIVW